MNKIKVITSNIRFDNPKDGNHIWANRISILTDIINNAKADFLGTQEGWRSQLYEFFAKLSDLVIVDEHRSWIEERMYPTIFINPKTFELIKSGDIWLSKTPSVPASKSFNSAFPRLCTWARVKHKELGTNLLLINVHLDHLETTTRQEQIKVLISEVEKIRKKNEEIILTGDFNEGPSEDVRKILIDSDIELDDSWLLLNKEEEASHHKFTGTNPTGTRIDWILTSKSLNPISTRLVKESTEGIFPSDHFPVISEYELKS